MLPRPCSGAGLEELAGGQGGVGASLSPLQATGLLLFPPWGSLRQEGIKTRVLSPPDYYDAESLQ